MRIVPCEPNHLIALAHKSETLFQAWPARDEEWAEELAVGGPCWTALLHDEPIACAGLNESPEGAFIAWTILGEAAVPHKEVLMDEVTNALDRHPSVRVALASLVDFKPSERWPKLMGFAVECVIRQLH
jgi:hypothetical protein